MADAVPQYATEFWFSGGDLVDETASERLSAYAVDLRHYIDDAVAYLGVSHAPRIRLRLATLYKQGHTWHSACRVMGWFMKGRQ